ncbi:MAG: DUF885 domain-containing protein [Bacteroidia bacterium]|nr:DUF885 domain-containing protein [Bacteroidia bacterium]
MNAESSRASVVLDSLFQILAGDYPEMASSGGEHRMFSKWDDRSDSFENNEVIKIKTMLQVMQNAINFEKLNSKSRMDYRIAEYALQQRIDDFRWRYYTFPFIPGTGLQLHLPFTLIFLHPVDSAGDAEAYLERLDGIPEVFQQAMEKGRKSASLGLLPPAFAFDDACEECRNMLAGYPLENAPDTNPLYNDFCSKVIRLKSIPAVRKIHMIEAAREVLVLSVKPAYNKLISFLKEEKRMAGDIDGSWRLPDAARYYSYEVNAEVGMDIDPEELFEQCLTRVHGIHARMHDLIKSINWKNDNLHEFFNYLRTDSRFYFPEGAAGWEKYRRLQYTFMDSIKESLPEYFDTSGLACFELRQLPAYLSNYSPVSTWVLPSDNGLRCGVLLINGGSMKNLPLFDAEASAYSGLLPGIQLVTSRKAYSTTLPQFRKYISIPGFIRGWSLYACEVMKKAGGYRNALSDFGRLNTELYFTILAITDLGIHRKKWTRTQAEDFMLRNSPVSDEVCHRAVEFCILHPGHGIDAVTGRDKILEWENTSTNDLGTDFTLRQFHTELLQGGAMPWNLLGEHIHEWIARSKKK